MCAPEELVERIGPSTRAVSFSHVTSPTTLVLPAEEICAAARAAGALAIVDGAHVPGHLPLDISTLGADVYAGNCHKWLCAPKGAGFLWARPEHQEWIEPLVVSWGWREDADFAERHGWAGTRDPAAYLSVPKAIEVHATFDPDAQRAVADDAERRLAELGLRRAPGEPAPFMRAVELPASDPRSSGAASTTSIASRRPCTSGRGARFSASRSGRTTTSEDVDRLVAALRAILV